MRKNPYLISYMCLAIVCCLALSILFFLNLQNMRSAQTQYNQDRVEAIAEDWSRHIQELRELSLKLSVSTAYQPYVFLKHPYDEIQLLQEFTQYQNASLFTDELFLYYGRDKLYRTDGKLDLYEGYLQSFSEAEQERIREGLAVTGYEAEICMIGEDLFIFFPMRVSEGTYMSDAVLCAVVRYTDMKDRFEIVSGGSVEENLSVYWFDELVYCNQSTPCMPEQKNVLSVKLRNIGFVFCFLPEKTTFMGMGQMLLQVLIVLTDVIMLFVVANLYAKRSYGTILNISQKFRSKTSFLDENDCENALEEINYVMDSLLQRNEQISIQVQAKHEQLQRQALRMLLEDNYLFDPKSYLEKMQLKLEGPYFFVMVIAFNNEDSGEQSVLEKLQIELEKITSKDRQESVYAICDYIHNRLNVICCIRELERKENMIELIHEVSDSYKNIPRFGIGHVCQNLSGLSASWLASLDNLHKGVEENNQSKANFTFDSSRLSRLVLELKKADVEQAMEEFRLYIQQVEKENFSLLMQQYIFSEFINVVVRAAKDQQIELSNQSISLIVSARALGAFKEAAEIMIREFAERMQKKMEQRSADKAMQIYEYIKQHYAEYDLSIEKVAENMNTTVYAVRKAVLEHSGMKYKDYVINLRIEYAKSMLLKEDKSIAEIGEMCGYTNLPYFITLFKEVTGVTPSKYRAGN